MAGPDTSHRPVVLFDGACGLCHGSVAFVRRRDRRGALRFVARQSTEGARLLQAHGLTHAGARSVLLVADDGVRSESAAVLHILRRAGGPLSLAYAAMLVPAPIRDAAYRFIAARRHRWFRRTAVCGVPSPDAQPRLV